MIIKHILRELDSGLVIRLNLLIKYFYPELYVENIFSNKIIVETGNGDFIKITVQKPPVNLRFYGYVLYEDVFNYLDLPGSQLCRDVIVLYDKDNGLYRGIYLSRNVKLRLIEIRGYEPVILVREGDFVTKNSSIAYIVTKKREVRNIKSSIDGYVVLIVEIFWEKPERYVLAVVDKNEFRQIAVREG